MRNRLCYLTASRAAPVVCIQTAWPRWPLFGRQPQRQAATTTPVRRGKSRLNGSLRRVCQVPGAW